MELGKSVFFFSIFILGNVLVDAQKAVQFMNPGDYLEIAHHSELAPKEFTIEFWLKVNDLGDPDKAAGEMTVIDKRGNNTGYNIRLAGTAFPLPIFAFYQDGGVSTPDPIKKKNWHHVAVVQSSASLSIYIDGLLKGQESNAGYIGNTDAPLRIGEFLGYPGASLGLRGELDDLRFWSEVRDSAQIKSNIHTAFTGNEPGLVGLWDFDNQVGGQIRNQAGNRHHAQVNGNTKLVVSDAPVGFIPPLPSTSVRAIGEFEHIQIEWEPDSALHILHIYRSLNPDFEPDLSHLIASVPGVQGLFQDSTVAPNTLYFYTTRSENQESRISQNSALLAGRIRPRVDDYSTGVYYYPWYGPTQGGHDWIGQYVRDRFIPRHPPLLDHYSSRDTAVIQQHLDWMTAYGIDFLVSSWWGRNSWEDITLASAMLGELDETDIKFSVYYESAIHGINQGQIEITTEARNELVKNFEYLAENYFDHPNYLTIDGRHVVYIYLSGIYTGQYKEAFVEIRQKLTNMGYDLFLIGDEMGFDPPDPNHMDFLDAISPYIMFGLDRHEGYPADTDYLADVSIAINGWEDVAKPNGIKIIPNVFPGFNNRELGFNVYAHPRRTSPSRDAQSFLYDYIRVVRPFTDPGLKMVMITSWNEWHEDSQLEPVIIAPSTSLDDTNTGDLLTQGYVYDGYGFKPLETVRTLLSDQSCNLSNMLTFTEFICPGTNHGKASLDVRGAINPLQVSWSTGDSSTTLYNLTSGTYSALLTDGGGCISEVEFTIAEAAEIQLQADSIKDILGDQPGSITLSVEGGISPYEYSWFRNDSLISKVSNPEILIPGVYAVQVTDQLGCTARIDSLVIGLTTSIYQIAEPAFKIYPNPAHHVMTITPSEPITKPMDVQIFNASGQVLIKVRTMETDIDLSDLKDGIYIVQLVWPGGMHIEKLIKI